MATTAHTSADPLSDPSRPLPRARLRSHPVLAFLLRRIGTGLLSLLIASVLVFGAVQILPGDVAQVVLGRTATPQRLAMVRADLHLNQPLPVRYLRWLGGMATGHFGNSSAALAQGEVLPVWQAIRTPLRNSLILAALTIVIFIPLCLVLGTLAALRAGRKTDHAISLGALSLSSLPEFLVATLLIVIFFSQLNLFPPVSTLAPGQTPFSNPKGLVLPVLSLLAVSTAFGTRLLRASVVEVLREDYVAMARLNGFRERLVIWRYALRNALAPSVQVLAQMIQYLIGGIIIIESVFNYPGIGSALVQAVLVRDPQVVSVVAMLLATIYISVNILADLAVVLLVPRLRTQL
jgi:peptide/nickel transport system permease protein